MEPSPARILNATLCRAARDADPAAVAAALAEGADPSGAFDPEVARAEALELERQMAEYRVRTTSRVPPVPEEVREAFEASTRALDSEMFKRQVSAPYAHDIPLHCAAESGSAECVRLLLAAGADPTRRDNRSCTAVFTATSSDVLTVLTSAGLSLEERDELGWTPLVGALSDGEDGIARVDALIAAGADVNATHDRGYTVLMSAAGSSRLLRNLKALVAAGADPHAVSELGFTALHAAIDVIGEANEERSVRETLTYLHSLGLDLEARTNAGQTPLLRAMSDGNAFDVLVLCELGADPNAAGPLHECGAESCQAIDCPPLFHGAKRLGFQCNGKIEALLRHGADPLATDEEGLTALDYAVASLAAEGTSYEEAFYDFYARSSAVRLDDVPVDSRDAFIDGAMERLRPAIAAWAAAIPVDTSWDHAAEIRAASLRALELLAAHWSWARYVADGTE